MGGTTSGRQLDAWPADRRGGRRVCLVDAQLLDDQQVLERWWGKDVAAEIRLHQRCRAAKAGAGLP